MSWLLGSVLLVAGSLFQHAHVVYAIDCTNVPTYEGTVTLSNGATACSALAPGETDRDKGKHFVTCINGNLRTQDCTFGLRYVDMTMLVLNIHHRFCI